MINNAPLVSVCVITYNHEHYILKTIETILDQDCDFLFEIIISNDNSPDNSDKVIRRFIKNHPKSHIIRYIKQKKNLGMVKNFFWTIEQGKGKYIAICEGDDYWTDNKKLAKQVKSLESDSSIVGSFHDVQVKNGKSFHMYHNKRSFAINKRYSLKDYIENFWLIPTCSIVFQKDKLEIPDFFYDIPVGDGPLLYSLFSKGDFVLDEGLMGFYRMDNPKSAMNTYRNLDSQIVNSYVVKILVWILKKDILINPDFIYREIDRRNDKVIEKTKWLQLRLNSRIKFFQRFKTIIQFKQ